MNQYGHRVRMHQDPQYPMESGFMDSHPLSALTSDVAGLQTHDYNSQIISSEPKLDLLSAASLSSSWLADAARQLQEIRLEVEEACELDSETEVVQGSVYDEAYFLLNVLHHIIPMPDIMWLEDGGIGLEWRTGDGIATVSLYGDGFVTYGATWKGSREISGTCPLSDSILLPHFLNVLREFFRQAEGGEGGENFDIQVTLPLKHVLPQHKMNAEHKAKEAFVLELLRQGEISAGRAASLLNISRWALSDLMFEAGISPFDDSLTSEAFAAEVADALKDFDERRYARIRRK